MSLGILVDMLEAMVGADDFLRLTKLWVVGGFVDEIGIGTIEDLVPLLMDYGDPLALPCSLVVADCT